LVRQRKAGQRGGQGGAKAAAVDAHGLVSPAELWLAVHQACCKQHAIRLKGKPVQASQPAARG
ncbi:hypothetical protein, partial [Delftia acidovorans]|uniref:hypothetical protein n=1 Tax=Delftia acidovorans TaxID=80866 RepID=UPI0035A0797C